MTLVCGNCGRPVADLAGLLDKAPGGSWSTHCQHCQARVVDSRRIDEIKQIVAGLTPCNLKRLAGPRPIP